MTVGEVANLSMDERKRMIAEDREKFLRDQASREDGARRTGGKEKSIEIARKMMVKKYPLSEISMLTGLDETELNRILH